MPRLSMFYGIAIYMYVREHGVAHFHARYGGDDVVVAVATRETLEGGLSRRQLRLVHERLALHRTELLMAWERASKGEPPGTIDPLP